MEIKFKGKRNQTMVDLKSGECFAFNYSLVSEPEIYIKTDEIKPNAIRLNDGSAVMISENEIVKIATIEMIVEFKGELND